MAILPSFFETLIKAAIQVLRFSVYKKEDFFPRIDPGIWDLYQVNN